MHYETSCGDLVKVLYWDTQGLCLFAKRLERGRFVWPSAREGTVSLTPVQLSMLLEGIDWRMPRARRPLSAGRHRSQAARDRSCRLARRGSC